MRDGIPGCRSSKTKLGSMPWNHCGEKRKIKQFAEKREKSIS
jgi:hypothetical protein